MNLYDLKKMFDGMWYQETMNDMWDVGVQDDKFALMAKMNKQCNISIKTPVGMTERFLATEIEMQGTVPGPLKASVQVDSLGRDCYKYKEGLFLYKQCVYVPPLSMCDDVVSVANCGVEALKTNAIINAKMMSKKLEFGPKKCFNIHVGKNSENCSQLKVHESVLNKRDHETYLGQIICNSGTNFKNIENKKNIGIGAVSQVFAMLSQVSLGHYYFEIALVMRDAMLVSKLVSSSEALYGVKKQEFKKLENVDEMFFRNMFNVPVSTPKESLYIETGKINVKIIIKMRRVMFWWHIVNLEKNEVLYKFYMAQKLNISKDDWCQQLQRDKEDLGLHLEDEEVKGIKKETFRNIVKNKIEKFAEKHLLELKNSHSKTENIKFSGFKPAPYLMSKNLTTGEMRTLFQLRTRMMDVKGNFSSAHTNNMWCKLCHLFIETQQHLLECPEIRLRTKNLINFKEAEYEMVFSNIKNQEKIAKIYKIIIEARKEMVKKN